MKILVTGGLGHIGSALIDDLLASNNKNKITVIDNFLSERYCSVFKLRKNKIHFNFYKIDLSFKSKNLEKLIKQNNIIVHLAAITDATSSFDNPTKVANNNFKSTKNIAELCSIYKKKLIFIEKNVPR